MDPSSPRAGAATDPPADRPQQTRRSLYAWWHGIPLYWRILAACLVGAVVGVALRELDAALRAGQTEPLAGWYAPLRIAEGLAVPSRLVLRLLGALAAPLVLMAVVQALMQAQIPRGSAVRLISLLLLNTLVAILIGLAVANVLQPGRGADLGHAPQAGQAAELKVDPLA
jgi:Na+/H+-dicarboxylate symporter